ncbi:MAG: quinolinate synthase NadA [Chitinophagaceae bacterium]|nr:quinolinate synthase NadA [Oligoflexus sp.]
MTSSQQTLDSMHAKLGGLLPDFEIEAKAVLVDEINRLKVERNAVILGHNYMEPALFHCVADIKGDSLELCRKAAETTKDIIVFCGVEFMAESAKILNPTKKVLIPSKKAGCSLASSITPEDVQALKKQFPGVPVLAYINTYAAVKAEVDICVTSGNAVKIAQQIDSDQIIFVPDEYLARNIAKATGKKIIFPENVLDSALKTDGVLQKVFVGWHGKCEVHDLFTVQDIKDVRAQYPDVVVLAHPECPPDVVDASDFSGSTSAMINYVRDVSASRYLLLTECAMADNIIAEHKNKEVLRLCSHRCPHMAQITLQDTLDALLYDRYEITLNEELRLKAKRSIDRMLEMS